MSTRKKKNSTLRPMSIRQPSQPEVIHFQGIWAGLPGMHQYYGATDNSLSFESSEQGIKRRVMWSHDPEISPDYLFLSMNPHSVAEGYKIYDLVIDESERYARLYVIRTIGEAATRGDEAVEHVWHEFQRESGLVLPNMEDKANFQRIFEDFCKAAVTHSGMN